ncbi:MAG: hypothetical protein ACLFVK_06910, partial [Dehalococcoidia bacterium]
FTPQGAGKAKKSNVFPAGSIFWKQGRQWKAIIPPYNQRKPLNLPAAPDEARTKRGSPQETLTVVGQVPFDVSVDLGVVDAFIDSSEQRISFCGKGEKTDVGKRMPSPTKGLSFHRNGGVVTPKSSNTRRKQPKRGAKVEKFGPGYKVTPPGQGSMLSRRRPW